MRRKIQDQITFSLALRPPDAHPKYDPKYKCLWLFHWLYSIAENNLNTFLTVLCRLPLYNGQLLLINVFQYQDLSSYSPNRPEKIIKDRLDTVFRIL